MNKFYYGSGGSLMCDEEIPGVTQTVDEASKKFYKEGKYFVGESMSRKAAEKIASALGGELQADPQA